MFRIYFYLFASINFLALICLFIVSYVNVIFIREEFIEIPKIQSNNKKISIIPNEVKNNDYNFKILDHDNDKFLETFNSKNLDFKKDIDKKDKNLLDKKKEIKKFIVQLGVFKNKKNADNQLKTINKHKKLLFKKIKINLLKTNSKNNNLLYYIETNAITKKIAIDLCEFFKKKKINCIIKIRK